VMRVKLAWTVSVVVVLLVIVLVVPIKNQLTSWNVLPTSEGLTELYFTHSTMLPSTYIAKQKQTVLFTIHNEEYRTETYHYEIMEAASVGTPDSILASGIVTLRQGESRDVAATVAIQPLAARVNVSVVLTNQHESVQYWLNEMAA
jgi:hypothetical protein